VLSPSSPWLWQPTHPRVGRLGRTAQASFTFSTACAGVSEAWVRWRRAGPQHARSTGSRCPLGPATDTMARWRGRWYPLESAGEGK
jgi:hypothetical protein